MNRFQTGHGGGNRSRRDHPPPGSSGRSNAPPSRHLWVGNLSLSILEPDLRDHFLKYGELESVAFQPGRSYAFVNFKIEEEAIAAINALQGSLVAGNPLKIEFAKPEEGEDGNGGGGSGADVNGGGGADGNGDYDNVVVPDSVEVDRLAAGNNATRPSRDRIVLDWLEGEFCISCNTGSGQVLVCSEDGCLVAIHQACVNYEPKFDVTGRFYCPYCWYKRELERTKELRRRALLAKKELLNSMCLKRDGGNEEKWEDEADNMEAASVSTMAGKLNSGDCENVPNDDGNEMIHHNQEETPAVESVSKEKSEKESISKTHGFGNVGDGERLEEDIENASDSGDDEIDEDRWRMQPSGPSHLEIVKNALDLSTKETSGIEVVLEDNQGKKEKEKEESVLPNAVETTTTLITKDATSKVPAIESYEFVSPDLGTRTLVVHQKRVTRSARRAQTQKVDSPKNTSFQQITNKKDMNQQGKARTAKNSVQRQESTKRTAVPILGTDKRRRLHWSTEEKDMLKEGVRRYLTTTNKNIPWRKILEFGQHVFDTTRTPVDLKDKWKNMMAKESPKKQKGLLVTSGGTS